MKKFVIVSILAVAATACSNRGVINQDVVKYNHDRLDYVEEYLKSGDYKKVETEEKYRSLEREAVLWVEEQQKQAQ